MESLDWHSVLWFIVEMAKALAWPIVVLILLCRFRPWLPQFVDWLKETLRKRGLEFSLFGGKAAISAEQTQQKAAESPIVSGAAGFAKGAATVMGAGVDASKEQTPGGKDRTSIRITFRDAVPARPAVAIVEEQTLKGLERMAPEDREAWLVRSYATLMVQASHEFMYNRIFGSQIEGLKQLDLAPAGIPLQVAQQFFRDQVTRLNLEFYANYGFDGWLGFLAANNLVAKDEKVGHLTITPFGHDFLVYLREMRLSEAKPW